FSRDWSSDVCSSDLGASLWNRGCAANVTLGGHAGARPRPHVCFQDRRRSMAIFEDALKGGNIVTGLAIGVGMVLLAPMLKPLVRSEERRVGNEWRAR